MMIFSHKIELCIWLMVVCVLSVRSLDCVTSLRFCNSLIMSASQCRNLGWGDHFVTCAFEFVSQLRTISVDNTEFCVLCAIVLTFPGL